MGTGVGIKRDVSTIAKFVGAAGGPIDRRIQDICSLRGVPFDPGVSFTAQGRAFADHQANMLFAMKLHPLIQCDGFTFAISHRRGLHLVGRLPFRAEAVGNRPQIFHPKVNQPERKILLGRTALGQQDGSDSGHLSVVGSRIDSEIKRRGEAGKRKEADETENEGPKFPGGKGVDAYENHSNYGTYKQRGCQSRAILRV